MQDFIIMIIFLVLAAGCIAAGRVLSMRREKYLRGMNSFIDTCRRYEGIVLDVKDVPIDAKQNVVHAAILQFRDEEQGKTIVHRYTGTAGQKYSRGDKVTVYYNEKTDSACIKEDNIFAKKALLCRRIKIMLYIFTVIFIIAGILIFIS